MSANGKVNSIKHLTVDTATVTVNVLKFEDRQITLAVWGQIFKKSPVEVKDNKFTLTADKLQGIVNRCIPIECEKHNTLAQNHRHFLWSEGDEIWRGVVYKDKESRYNDEYNSTVQKIHDKLTSLFRKLIYVKCINGNLSTDVDETNGWVHPNQLVITIKMSDGKQVINIDYSENKMLRKYWESVQELDKLNNYTINKIKFLNHMKDLEENKKSWEKDKEEKLKQVQNNKSLILKYIDENKLNEEDLEKEIKYLEDTLDQFESDYQNYIDTIFDLPHFYIATGGGKNGTRI